MLSQLSELQPAIPSPSSFPGMSRAAVVAGTGWDSPAGAEKGDVLGCEAACGATGSTGGLQGAKVLVLRLLPEGRREQMWFLKASLEMFSQKRVRSRVSPAAPIYILLMVVVTEPSRRCGEGVPKRRKEL